MKVRFFVILFMSLSLTAFSQESPLTSHFLLNPMSINPSYAGSGSGLRLSAYHFNQWTGIEGAPRTNTFSADIPLSGERVGLGIILYNDKIGVTHENELITDYAYRIDIADGVLALGLGASINFFKTNYSDLVVVDPGDERFLEDSRTYISPNIRFGVYYSIDNFYAGFSIPEFLTTKYDYNKGKQVIINRGFSGYNFLLNSGYTFDLSKKFSLTPSALLSYSENADFNYYLSLEAVYNDLLSFTASYCNYNIISAIVQVQVTDRFKIGYTYEIDAGKLGRYNNGSHAIMLRYVFRSRVNVYNPLDF